MRSQVRFRLLVIAAIVAFSLVLSACGAPARAPAAMDAAVSSESAPAVAYEMAEAAAEMPAGASLIARSSARRPSIWWWPTPTPPSPR
ncbi:MAG: hypothetical protein R3A10_05135 [Caldilineaceae bacterium]